MKIRYYLVAVGLFLAVGLGVLMFGGSRPAPAAGWSAPTGQQLRERCLYAAVDAYPRMTASPLDTLPACKPLWPADKALLRRMVSDFLVADVKKNLGG